MTNPTSNFNWQMPTASDLVTDLPADFETFGQAVDTSLADLKGGTTGQVLSKASNTDMDFTWVAQDDSNAIQNAIVDAKGDLIAASAADTPARLAVGTNGQVLTADSTAATGLAWATPSGGSTNVAGKNAVINGAMDIWQRGTSSTAGGANYRADRWYSGRGGAVAGGTWTRQSSALDGFQYCLRVARDNGNTSTATFYLSTTLETANSIPFAGKTATLSFYARAGANFSPTSGNINVYLKTGTGTDQNVSETWTGNTNVVASSATLTTTWQRFTYSGSIATTATEIGVNLEWTPVGTAGANDYLEITGVQLEIASSASAFNRNAGTIQGELAACKYYYDKRGGQSGTGGVLNNSMSNGAGTNATMTFAILMRVAPTAVEYANLRLSDTSSGFTVSSVTLTNSTPTTGSVNVATTGMTGFRSCYLDSSATGNYIAFSAEL